MTDDELAVLRADRELADLFLAEALDHLGKIEAALLELEERPGDAALLNDIFRPFHTVKGNAGALGLTSIEAVAHRVETLLDRARSGRRTIGRVEVDVVLSAVDVLSMMVRNVAVRLAGQPGNDLTPVAAALIASVGSLIGDDVEAEPGRRAAPDRDGATADVSPDDVDGLDDAGSPDAAADAAATMRRGNEISAIKVDARKLDGLVDAIGELIVVQSRLQEHPGLAVRQDETLTAALGQLERMASELQRSALSLRTVPIRQAFQKVSRVVRDASRKANKSVELILVGEDTELDRKIVEGLTDALVHMVRNSIDHGIEPPDVRAAAGKRAEARVTLSACHRGGEIVVEIADDGKGLDTARIKARAVAHGLIDPDETLPLDRIHALIFDPGFSTAERVTEISGRGVGMDVVRRNIEALRGRVEIATQSGGGTAFTIRLPLALAVLDGLIAYIGRERFILPAAAVRESMALRAARVHAVQGAARLVEVGDVLIPLARLGDLLDLPHDDDSADAAVVVVEDAGCRIALVVDGLAAKQEVVVKSLGETFAGIRGLTGAAILRDGRIGLVLDVRGVVELQRGMDCLAA